jgi:hypothetical protein
MMSIQPSEFWNMSPVEIYSAITGFKEFNGGEDKSSKAMTQSELAELMELHPD